MCRNPCNCAKRHFLLACHAGGGRSTLKLSDIQSIQHGHMVKHVTCLTMRNTGPLQRSKVFIMLSSHCTTQKREHTNHFSDKHVTHTGDSGCKKKISALWHFLIPEALHCSLWELYQLTDGMQFKLTWSINHVMDHNETPFRLELKDPWCGSKIKQKSNLD